jgi:hypothetical protein
VPPFPIEPRIRLTCHFPNQSFRERKAFSVILTYLLAQQDTILHITGFTQNDGLIGQWWSPQLGGWVEDDITVVTIDVKGEAGDQRLAEAIMDLKNYAHECYEEADAYQEELWITTYSITRHLS